VSWLFTTILNWLGGGVLDRVLGHLEAKAKSDTERLRIVTVRDQHAMTTQARVVTAGMAHKAFWIPWLIATVPLSCWFAWGMLDTIANGGLPDVAEIPSGLDWWARVAWQNVFYTGGGVAAATIIAQAIPRR
jgi:hypothetical protein